MHRSRLSTVVIDCAEEDFERALAFWSQALGKEVMREPGPRYASLRGRVGGDGGAIVLLQSVPAVERALPRVDAGGDDLEAPAVHLDLETDDVEAEVARLARLGARVKARIRGHVVMVAPSGHAFCVVPVHRGDFAAKSTTWSEG